MAALAGHIGRAHKEKKRDQLLLEAINRQNLLLQQILQEIRALRSELQGLQAIEAKTVEKTIRKTITSPSDEAIAQTPQVMAPEKKLPSFLRLSKTRRRERSIRRGHQAFKEIYERKKL